ncbi:MAG: ABC transporter ATP-binding protein [Nanoarchaeota archaeon]
MEIISLKEIKKSFRRKNVLHNVNLSVKEGEIIGLIGKSGSGKSVLMKIIIGFLEPDKGIITINNLTKNKINFSMQGNSIYDYLTVKQNLRYFSKMYGLSRKERKIIIPEIINNLELKDFENIIVKKLSGGTQKRVDIGCAMINDPNILILDEPFLGLDPELVKKLSTFIWNLNRRGKTIIISSHDIPELSKICSRFMLIKNGDLILIKKDELAGVYK